MDICACYICAQFVVDKMGKVEWDFSGHTVLVTGASRVCNGTLRWNLYLIYCMSVRLYVCNVDVCV